MIIAIWDFLFTRKTWTIIHFEDLVSNRSKSKVGIIYVLQDQFGNIKRKSIKD